MMGEKSLSILIPARNEMFLAKTVKDILENMRGDTEVIVVCDGQWADPPIEDHPKVTIIYHSVSIGQRAATNEAARISKAKYVMKCDAHCGFDEGFDVKMMEVMQDNWTMVPIMRNLHAFDWVCLKCNDRTYQGITPIACAKCGNTKEFKRDVVWISKTNPQSTSYCFDPEPHFQYFREFKSRPECKGDLTETMSLQGSCFMMTRDKYWGLNVCDETFGSWGSQGIEVAVKSWLSGGRVIVNHRTWYSHMFRTKGGDFGFPYPISGRQTQYAKKHSRDLFFNNKWPLQKRPLSWLLEKFWPVPGWTEQQLADLKKNDFKVEMKADSPSPAPVQSFEAPQLLSKGLVYYTDNRIDPIIADVARAQLNKICNGFSIVSVSLAPIEFGYNIVLAMERGILAMTKQILTGLERLKTDIAFLTEHDIIYHPSHFDFVPPRQDVFYYNENVWKVRSTDGQALFFHTKQTSGCCAYRELLIEHYKKRVERIEREGFNRSMGFEPGCHRLPNGVDNYKAESWMSEFPNVDIRHGQNLTWSRFKKEQYRSQRSIRGWTLADEIPFWGKTKDRFDEFLKGVKDAI
jgi:glycosyltransferase involved in cell wall biosynthesis